MSNETLSLIVVLLLVVTIIFLFVRLAKSTKRYGGNMTTTMHASTYEFLSKDKREAVEQIVELKANKKMEEESNDKPK